jgi:hypothetical protein
VEARAALVALDGGHLDAAHDRLVELAGVGLEVLGDSLMGDERVGVGVEVFHAGEAIMPGRSVHDQGVPPPGAPPLGDAAPLEHEVGHASPGEVFAHRDTGLAASDDEHFRLLLNRHSNSVPEVSAVPGQASER